MDINAKIFNKILVNGIQLRIKKLNKKSTPMKWYQAEEWGREVENDEEQNQW